MHNRPAHQMSTQVAREGEERREGKQEGKTKQNIGQAACPVAFPAAWEAVFVLSGVTVLPGARSGQTQGMFEENPKDGGENSAGLVPIRVSDPG